MPFRINVYSSHIILGKRGGKRKYILASVIPHVHYSPPFRTRKQAEKKVVEQKKYNERHNPDFRFRLVIVERK